MKLPHLTLGVVISAIGVVAAIWYYRSQAAASAAQANNNATMGGFPYFQTAALPSSGLSAASATPTTSATPSLDTSSLLQALVASSTANAAGQGATLQANQASLETAGISNEQNLWSDLLGNVASQQITNLGPTYLTQGAVWNTNNGFGFSVQSSGGTGPQQGVTPLGGLWTGGQFGGTPGASQNPFLEVPPVTGSTNTTPTSSTVANDNTTPAQAAA